MSNIAASLDLSFLLSMRRVLDALPELDAQDAYDVLGAFDNDPDALLASLPPRSPGFDLDSDRDFPTLAEAFRLYKLPRMKDLLTVDRDWEFLKRSSSQDDFSIITDDAHSVGKAPDVPTWSLIAAATPPKEAARANLSGVPASVALHLDGWRDPKPQQPRRKRSEDHFELLDVYDMYKGSRSPLSRAPHAHSRGSAAGCAQRARASRLMLRRARAIGV